MFAVRFVDFLAFGVMSTQTSLKSETSGIKEIKFWTNLILFLNPIPARPCQAKAKTRDGRVGDSKRCSFSEMSPFCSFCLIKMEKVISGERKCPSRSEKVAEG